MSRPTVKWEITRSCDLACRHCTKPDDDRRPGMEELSTYEAYKTVDQIASLNPRQLIITGGDPLARSDVFQIVDYARHRGLKPAIELVPTANLTAEAIDKLNGSGVATFIFSIDGATPYRQDLLTGLRGSFERTTDAIDWARKTCLPIEVNTMLTRRSISDLVPIGDLLSTLGVAAWNVHFLVPVGAARKLDILTAAEVERALAVLARIQEKKRFRIRTVEAPQYRRYLIQRRFDQAGWSDFRNYLPDEIADCTIDDIVFIGGNGAVRPSQFLPVAAGNIRYRPLFAITHASDLFVAFRDRSNLTGKCGRCEYREVCGGSRARAWATTGLLFSPDPLCAHQPQVGAGMEAAS